VKSFADTAFFLLFEEVLRKDRPKNGGDSWSAAGVAWQKSRHTFETNTHGFTIEVYEGRRTGRAGWIFLVVREHWWAGRHGDVVRSAHWAKPLAGKRSDIMAWFKARQKETESAQ
jgi:hypothetical protein